MIQVNGLTKRFGTLTAGMCFCLCLLLSAYLRGYEAAGLLLFAPRPICPVAKAP